MARQSRKIERARREAADCRACPLWRDATQTVFGEGGRGAWLMLVGEQPGDQEDKEGRPFVGPAGRLLRRALAEAGLAESEIYLTNAVKHFKWRPRGKRRIHERPNQRELAACRIWLEIEIEAVAPRVALALGATAGRALLGRTVRVGAERGRPLGSAGGTVLAVTVHPSAIIRMPEADSRREAFDRLVAELRDARRWSAGD